MTNLVSEGFTKVQNNLLETLIGSRLTSRELRVVLFAIRFGFGLASNGAITVMKSEIAEACGIAPQDVRPTLESLSAKKITRYEEKTGVLAIAGDAASWCGSLAGGERLRNLRIRLIERVRGLRNSLTPTAYFTHKTVRNLRTPEKTSGLPQAEKPAPKERERNIYKLYPIVNTESRPLKLPLFAYPEQGREMTTVLGNLRASPKNPDALILRIVKRYGEKETIDAFSAIRGILADYFFSAVHQLTTKIHDNRIPKS